eukprot:942713_1
MEDAVSVLPLLTKFKLTIEESITARAISQGLSNIAAFTRTLKANPSQVDDFVSNHFVTFTQFFLQYAVRYPKFLESLSKEERSRFFGFLISLPKLDVVLLCFSTVLKTSTSVLDNNMVSDETSSYPDLLDISTKSGTFGISPKVSKSQKADGRIQLNEKELRKIAWIISELLEPIFDENSVRIFELFDSMHVDSSRTPSVPSTHTVAIIAAICSLPDLVATRMHRDVPTWLRARSFVRLLSACVARYVESGRTSENSLEALTHLLSKLCRTGNSRELVEVLLPNIAQSSVHDRSTFSRYRSLITGISPTASATFLEHTVRTLASSSVNLGISYGKRLAMFSDLCSGSVESHSLIRHSITDRLLLAKVLPVRCLDFIIALVDKIDSPTKSSLDPSVTLSYREWVLEQCVSAWNSRSMVQHTSLPHHTYLTHAIVRLIRLLCSPTQADQATGDCGIPVEDDMSTEPVGSGDIGENPALLPELLRGVKIRLESSLEDVRILGMAVAEAFSVILMPSKPLRFDELRNSAFEKDLNLPPLADQSSESEEIIPYVANLKLDEESDVNGNVLA